VKKGFLLALCMFFLFAGACASGNETCILLGADEITVDGKAITQDAAENVCLAFSTESHEDVPDALAGIENRIITITDSGVYRISGKAQDAQIAVRADAQDEVHIILDGADISCRTAPAVAVYTAADTRIPGEYGVTIELAEGTQSVITGSHTEKTEEHDVKLSGAITSLVSLGFEGSGFLNVVADNEGIEVKNGHMTFNGGNVIVTSGDDPLNASEDGVSVITVNDGTLHLQVSPEEGGEGDGMDSNGAIVINGGAVSSFAHPSSMDSGIDSDLGCTINGGIVLGAGNMYDEISADSAQLFMALQFARKTEEMIVITDIEGAFVGFCESNQGYTSFVFSFPDLKEGDYHLWLGGEITIEDGKAVYLPGIQLQHSGTSGGHMGFGRTGGNRPEKGFRPNDPPERPEGMTPHQAGGNDPGMMRPGMEFGGKPASGAASTVFHLAPGSTMFGGITAVE